MSSSCKEGKGKRKKITDSTFPCLHTSSVLVFPPYACQCEKDEQCYCGIGPVIIYMWIFIVLLLSFASNREFLSAELPTPSSAWCEALDKALNKGRLKTPEKLS